MTTQAINNTALPPAPPDYLSAKRGLASWLGTTDHKRIGLMYMALILTFYLFAAVLSVTFRTDLMFQIARLLSNDGYNRLLTHHDVTMIFLFIIPGIPAIFGNFFLPILIGAEDVACPRLNLLSWYCYLAGGLLVLGSVVFGDVDMGWIVRVPYRVQNEKNIYLTMFAAFILGWSLILTGLNFVTTIHRLRAPGRGLFQMPLFAWALYATGWVQVIVTPVIGITLGLVMIEKSLHVPSFIELICYQPSEGYIVRLNRIIFVLTILRIILVVTILFAAGFGAFLLLKGRRKAAAPAPAPPPTMPPRTETP